jgi:4-alpha-glucanotransferase
VEDVPEYSALPDATREAIDTLGADLRVRQPAARQIERDPVWAAKKAALQLVHDSGAHRAAPDRAAAYEAFLAREGDELERFARWCALTEAHGADWHTWPAALHDPGGPAVATAAEALAPRVDFFRWLQWQLDGQLSRAQAQARAAGMRLGVIHDVAVGVSPDGADSWSYQDVLARGVTVGAPPDAYSQLGQNWNQPPWRPDRLAELAYAPLRDLFRTALRHAGGLRVDHVIGLFRLWWVPAGHAAAEGAYVRYDHEALLGILALEAQRAGAVIIGEDLGNVDPRARGYLHDLGLLGTSILWFETEWGSGQPLWPDRWREYCLASVTTHDLPPSTGYLAGDHIRLRAELGMLTRPVDDEVADDRAEKDRWRNHLIQLGLIAPERAWDDTAAVIALHAFLARTPALLRCAALTDAVGERRTQNQPGTKDEYPNWRIPLGGADGQPVLLEDLIADGRADAVFAAVRGDITG